MLLYLILMFQGSQSNIHELSLQKESLRQHSNQEKLQGEPAKRKDLEQLVGEVMDIFCEKTLIQLHTNYNIMRENEWKAPLKKICSKCEKKYRGMYYICLICERQYILCPNCEMEDKEHNQSHPFAKIKRLEQTIKSKIVETINIEDIQYQNEMGYKDIPFENDEEIIKQLHDKFKKLQRMITGKSTSYHPNHSQNSTKLSTQADKTQPKVQEQSQLEVSKMQNQWHFHNQEKRQSRAEQQKRQRRNKEQS